MLVQVTVDTDGSQGKVRDHGALNVGLGMSGLENRVHPPISPSRELWRRARAIHTNQKYGQRRLKKGLAIKGSNGTRRDNAR